MTQNTKKDSAALAAVGNAEPVASDAAPHVAHTPGPWAWYEEGELWSVKDREAFDLAFDAARDEKGDVEMRDLRFVDKAILSLLDNGDSPSDANAHLIAAAPDYHEAVELVKADCDELYGDDAGYVAITAEAYHALMTAHAKAEGRAPR